MSYDRSHSRFSLGTTGHDPDPESSREATPNLLRGPHTDPPTAIHTPTFNYNSRVNSAGSLLGRVTIGGKDEPPIDHPPPPVIPPSFTFNGGLGQVGAYAQGESSQVQTAGPVDHIPDRGVGLGEVTGDQRLQLWLQSVLPHPYTAPTLGPYPYGPPPLQVPAGYSSYSTAPARAGFVDPTPDGNVHQLHTQLPQPHDHLPYNQPTQPHHHPSHAHDHLLPPYDYAPPPHNPLPSPHTYHPQPYAQYPQHNNHPKPIPIQPAFAGSSSNFHPSTMPQSNQNATSADHRALKRELARLREEKNRLQVQCGHIAQEMEGWKTRAAEVPVLQERLAAMRKSLGAADDFTHSALSANRASLASKDEEIERLAKLVSEQEAKIKMWQAHHATTLVVHSKERMAIKDEDRTDALRKRRRAGAQAGASSGADASGADRGDGEGGHGGHGGNSGTGGDVKPVV